MNNQLNENLSTVYSGLPKLYFLAIFREIINLGDLKKTNKIF
jgi:hypothetical protein|tara:strand:+ start:73 stop:198 length:126 start_codon:yes stop_codon:yes gene_type:complete